jgi:hypothetical protein
MAIRIFVLLASIHLSGNCPAWGPTGHRVIGHIAEQHLSARAKKAIEEILGHESLAMASTYMDEVRSDTAFDNTRDWHWVTIPDGDTYDTSEKNPNGDVVEAIERMKASLRDRNTSPEDKKRDLRFLVHLIGDLHQPLHVGRGDDRGGNQFQVRWMKQGSNLHRVWDSGIIDLQELSYTELAQSLEPVTPELKAQWQKGTTAEWAQESLQWRAQIYAVEKGDDLGYEYSYKNWPLVREQLRKGGVRLASVLNAIFKQAW